MNGPVSTRDGIVSPAVGRSTADPSKCGVVKFLRVSFDAPDVDASTHGWKVAPLHKTKLLWENNRQFSYLGAFNSTVIKQLCCIYSSNSKKILHSADIVCLKKEKNYISRHPSNTLY